MAVDRVPSPFEPRRGRVRVELWLVAVAAVLFAWASPAWAASRSRWVARLVEVNGRARIAVRAPSGAEVRLPAGTGGLE